MFRDERTCFDFVIASRWPDGFRCPKCGNDSSYGRTDRLLIECANCRTLTSGTAGTVMHRTRIPISSWLLAAWLLVTDKRGISAKDLERTLGVSYETAYLMLHKLRAAMVNPDRERLRGTVEADESFLGGVKHGRRGKGTVGGEKGKFIILGAVEVRQTTDPETGEVVSRPGRLRFTHGANLRGETLRRFVTEVVEPRATVVTDGLKEYEGLIKLGYQHRVESTALGFSQEEVLKHLHPAFANLKTWMAGTFHGRVAGKHLQGYLNEFCFRFNRRDNLSMAFQSLLGIAGRVAGPTARDVFASRAL